MALCDCGEFSTRIQVKCTDDQGKSLPEPWKSICPKCAPEQFSRWQDPSNKHGGFRWQYEPEKYRKRQLADGMIFYEAKDERNADLEAQLLRGDPATSEAQQKAAALRRRNRRTKPLEPWEQEQAINRIRQKLEARKRAIQ
jgi:hypothetical protein